MHCIPQQPLLLSGSVAHNLDPDGHFGAEAHWEALRVAGLEPLVQSLPHGLETSLQALDEERVQLSAGQRQLLVLARLLLRRQSARLVLLDEPAAVLEQQGGTRLHTVIREHLPPSALAITVTHRVLPIVHLFTRILVLSEGFVAEDGPPAELLLREVAEGKLRQLFEEAPPRMQAHVKRMLALQRSQGISAVRTLLQYVNQAPAETPAAASASQQPLSPKASPPPADGPPAAAQAAPGYLRRPGGLPNGLTLTNGSGIGGSRNPVIRRASIS